MNAVDTTAQDPESGSFSVPKEGLWRFTMMAGDVDIPYGGSGYLNLKVDGTTVAISHTYTQAPAHIACAMSLNSIQPLSVGQIVTIEWAGGNGAYIDDTSSHYTHWTAQYLGASTPGLPEHQSEGQI